MLKPFKKWLTFQKQIGQKILRFSCNKLKFKQLKKLMSKNMIIMMDKLARKVNRIAVINNIHIKILMNRTIRLMTTRKLVRMKKLIIFH